MLTGAVVGAGYFADFHLDAWARVEGVEIVAVVDADLDRAEAAAVRVGARAFDRLDRLLAAGPIDFVDIVTPPATHRELALSAATAGVDVICQKPLAPSLAEAERLVEDLARHDIRFMVHENWRWQPWYRAIGRLVAAGVTGQPFHAQFTMRTGDGWAPNAYLGRQPYFRTYPRLLFHETGVHLIDTFRFLLGEIVSVYARTARRNPAIAGEDTGVAVLTFASGATAVFDGSRYNESAAADPRYTFGRFRLDAAHGHAEVDTDGRVRWTALGAHPTVVLENPPRIGFAGDSVRALSAHFVEQVRSGQPFESEGSDYLATVRAVEACYRSAETGEAIHLDTPRRSDS